MSARGEVVIAGVADIPLVDGRAPGAPTVLQIQARVADAALRDAGIGWDAVDGLLTSGSWGLAGVGQWPTMTLAEYLGLRPRYADSTGIGGAAFEAHVGHAAMALRAGMCDVALVVYGSTQLTNRSRSLAGRAPELVAQYETLWGLLSPAGAYAMVAQRHGWEFGTTSEQLAEVAVAARGWAALNPAATRRDPLTVEDVLASPLVSDPLHVLDCCLVTDGGAALVLTTADRVPDRARAVRVRGWGESQTHLAITHMPDLTRSGAADSGAAAMAMAGIGPADVDVLEVYDSFTITVLLALEALGFCGRGEGGPFVAGGQIAPGGALAVNTSGGGLSHAHPGMYGLYLLVEAVRQLRGECGARQVAGAEVALVNGTGGVLSSNATVVLTRD